jgi:hypothetical protein
VIAKILMPLYYKMNLVSIYEYLNDRFGIISYKIGAGFFILSRTLGSAIRLYLATEVLQLFLFEDLAKTDKQVIERLMNSNGSDIVFAIADPASIFEYQAQHDAKDIVILAALLTNAAFWAVDHDNHTVENLQHLDQFDKIVAYGEGTTSHRIARTINPQKTQSVPPKTEIEVLTQGNRQESVIVLTPDLVGLEKTLFNNNEYQVKLNVGSTTEFDEVLITALITRRDVIDHHPELVKEVLKGIQRACYLVQIDDADFSR